MGKSGGLRAGTRYAFSRGFKKTGMISLSTYLHQYKVGDIVDIRVNGAQQKGMPYKIYHGKTGIVYNVTKSAVGIIVHKKVGNRYIEKRVNVKIEHIFHSKCREEFVRRVKDNAARRKEAKANGEHVHLKRQIPLPRDARTVSTSDNLPQTIVPIPYETTI
ncbi:hypothetical protein ABW19_dt0206937 [Dactylella cylindrospora]|nr:hypothetical protein ABW19_dt0206937 [Dactylella cylindrospora]